MPRQSRASAASEDSLKENKDINGADMLKVKSEGEKVKSGKGKAASRVNDEEQEQEDERPQRESGGHNEASADDEDDEGDGSPKGRKRSRLNMDGDSRASLTEPEVKTLPRDTDGYIPGQIVRIQLMNFLTYDYANFNCGPYLNMIIGPNGTGKSSIACAIALGLNWSPSILGRAENISSFVKNDKEEGYVEIELKGPKGRRNLVIRRNMTSRDKSSSFTLNGKAVTGKEVTSKMAELNVQISNLCTFLPQDKVSSFAMMSPMQLLKETQKAAGNPSLTTWHETLIRAGKEHRTMLQSIQEEEARLKQMRERNESIEKDVERYQERKRIEDQIELLRLFIPSVYYNELRDKFNVAREKQRKLHKRAMELKEKNAPAYDFRDTLKKKMKSQEKDRERAKQAAKDKFTKMRQKWNENTRLETEAESLNSQIEELEINEQRRGNKIKTLEADIAKLQEELSTEVKVEAMEDLRDEMRQLSSERRGIDERSSESAALLETAMSEKSQVEMSMEGFRNEYAASAPHHHEVLTFGGYRLRNLASEDGRKLASFQRWDRDTHDAVVWIRQNRHRFRQEIIEPAVLCLTVKDQKYAPAVEACFAGRQIRTLVAQCREDYDLLNNTINEANNPFGRTVRVSTWYRDPSQVSLQPPPMTAEEMRALGFDGYAIDLVECPEGLKTYLKAEAQFHRVAISLRPNIDVEKAMELVARPTEQSLGGGNFITGSVMHQVTRSRYGRHARSNATSNVPPVKNLTAQTVDLEQKRKLEADLQEQQVKLEAFAEEEERLREQHRAVGLEIDEWQRKKAALEKRKAAIDKENQRKKSLQNKIARAQATMENERNKPSADAERRRIRRKIAEIAKKRTIIAKEYLNLTRAAAEELTASTRCGLEYLQISANKEALEELCNQKDAKFKKAMEEFNKVDAEYNQLKTDSKAAKQVAQDTYAAASEEHQAIWRQKHDKWSAYMARVKEAQEQGLEPPSDEDVDLRSSADLEAAMEEEHTQLELITKTNPGVIEQYEKRKKDIESLEAVLEKKNRDAQNVEKTINSAKSKWRPALQTLVDSIGEKFSAAFDRIGCAGEIRISEHEDYDKWQIDILVKFRDHEKLQLLTGQRQSGGERSLTTILYLMSLTEEARTPFSLVDEINQGMDQRAERVVHNSMVDVTCKDTAGQYFLITPKLLPDLNYHERMKVLCVANGEWLPEESGMGNLKSLIDGYIALKSGKSSKSH
ncbi:Structural maintenance of chromosomes protein 5 [Marasmius crinis-equi]|uniref:Structural maintenance of chromosomes protein 5 n=1 Tax=Marasmius crinis-equi TaxID=585013 RepID=A0ABR3G207_9AGAR